MFSRRLPPDAEPNALTRAAAAIAAAGGTWIDLTESNPTRAGIAYPRDLLAPLARPEALRYEPQPFGLPSAREAVAADCARRGAEVDPKAVVLTASTSEAYSWIFKLLCDPGDSVLVPRPSYPLFEHLTRLEGVHAEPYDLVFHGRWEVDMSTITPASERARAVLVVTPNNPTGSFISRRERAALERVCAERGMAVIADEVFGDYVLEDRADKVTDLAAHADVLTFSLGGFSKALGLPQLKLGWMVVGGPPALRGAALERLELIADSYLSVGTPVQVATPELLAAASDVRGQILKRIRTNLEFLQSELAAAPSCRALPVEGGWSAVVRVPAVRSEEQIALELLERERILVHPGYFFDFPSEAFLVISLLVPEEAFGSAVRRLLAYAAG